MWEKAKTSCNTKKLMDLGYSHVSSIVMGKLGIDSEKDADEFLHSVTVHDPAKIRNIEAVSDIIWDHIYSGKRICVFGDYDADGITGAAILYLALKKLGANVVVRLPDRIEEGYGISAMAIEEQMELGAELFVTIDNGIRANDEIALIRERGKKSIVLDHHQPGEILPEPDAMIDLWIPGETYPFCELTGSGLAWKVACYMLTQVSEYEYGMSLVDLAAIGTIADVAPLIGENRAIVKRALATMQSCWYSRYGVRNVYGKPMEHLTAEDIAFRIAPCINASGRLYERGAELPLLLLLETDEHIAADLARRVLLANEERKKIQQQCCESVAEEAAERIAQGEKVLVLYAQSAPSGVVGLIAGNLKEKYNRPCIVFSPKSDGNGNTIWCGSGRSITGYHLLNGLNACNDLFLHYGGHELAAGMSIPADVKVLDELRERLNEDASYLTDEDMMPIQLWDIEIDESDLTEDLYREMRELEPFGSGVDRPVFKMAMHTKEKNNKSHDLMGADKSHLKLYCDSYSAVGFSLATKYLQADLPGTVEGYGYPSENHFNGQVYKQFTLLDFEPIQVRCELHPMKDNIVQEEEVI